MRIIELSRKTEIPSFYEPIYINADLIAAFDAIDDGNETAGSYVYVVGMGGAFKVDQTCIQIYRIMEEE